MSVVFDTNIFISALTSPGGRGNQALTRIIAGKDSLSLSKPILDELLSVLARKFDHDQEQLAHIAVFLARGGELVEIDESVAVLSERPDDRILECALAAGAKCIVTGERVMLAVQALHGIEIVSLSDHLGSRG